MKGYDLSRAWFDFAYENARLVRPIHGMIYFWCIEKNNRLGWVDEFQLPTDEACRAIGVKDPKSFREALNDLITWGAIKLLQQAASQNVARWVSLKDCELTTAGCLDRAMGNESRLSEKRSSDTPSEPLSDTATNTPSGTPASPLNIKLQTTNHKPQTGGSQSSTEETKKIAYREDVLLSEKERQTLIDKHGGPLVEKFFDKLNAFKLSNGKKYKSDYHAILQWVVVAVTEDEARLKKGRPHAQISQPVAIQPSAPAPTNAEIMANAAQKPKPTAEHAKPIPF